MNEHTFTIGHLIEKSCAQVIIEVNDCALGLMGESQEEDRRMIADLVLNEMESRCGLMPQELMVRISTLISA